MARSSLTCLCLLAVMASGAMASSTPVRKLLQDGCGLAPKCANGSTCVKFNKGTFRCDKVRSTHARPAGAPHPTPPGLRLPHGQSSQWECGGRTAGAGAGPDFSGPRGPTATGGTAPWGPPNLPHPALPLPFRPLQHPHPTPPPLSRSAPS